MDGQTDGQTDGHKKGDLGLLKLSWERSNQYSKNKNKIVVFLKIFYENYSSGKNRNFGGEIQN